MVHLPGSSAINFTGISKYWIVFFAFVFFSADTFAETEIKTSPQELLARLDQVLNPGIGMLSGSLTLVDRTGRSNTWKITTFKNRSESLTLYERGRAGLEMKLLFREDGDKTYLYNALSAKLFQKNEEERYDSHLGSGFSFIDLSYYPYQSNYNPSIENDQVIKGVSYFRVNLKPIVPYKYKKIIMFMNKANLRPERLDFYDKSENLIKTMNIRYSLVKLKEKKLSQDVVIPSRFEMMDITNETTSFLEYQEIDRDVILHKSLFEVVNLNRSE